MKTRFLIVTIMFGLAVFITSCKKDSIEGPESLNGDGIENLIISPDFDWETTAEYSITFTAYAQSLVQISTEDGIVQKIAMLSNEQATIVKFKLPAYVQRVYLSYLGNETEIELTDTEMEYSFN